MVASARFVGDLVGYRYYTSTDKETGKVTPWHIYMCLVKQRVDDKTKLPKECELCEVKTNEEVLGDKLKFNQKVEFWREERFGKNGTYNAYVDIAAVQ